MSTHTVGKSHIHAEMLKNELVFLTCRSRQSLTQRKSNLRLVMCASLRELKHQLEEWKLCGCNGISCQPGVAEALPDGIEEGNLSDDEREGGEEKEKKKKLKKKKKVILLCCTRELVVSTPLKQKERIQPPYIIIKIIIVYWRKMETNKVTEILYKKKIFSATGLLLVFGQ